MARTACWRMQDGELVEKVVQGTEVPEGWYDNPRLEEIPEVVAEPEVGVVEDVVVMTETVVAEAETAAESEVVFNGVEPVTNVVDEQVSEPEVQEAE